MELSGRLEQSERSKKPIGLLDGVNFGKTSVSNPFQVAVELSSSLQFSIEIRSLLAKSSKKVLIPMVSLIKFQSSLFRSPISASIIFPFLNSSTLLRPGLAKLCSWQFDGI